MPSLFAMISAGQERHEVILRLTTAVELLAGAMDIRLLPPSGGNIAFALRHARDGRDVASVKGGIAVLDGKFHPSGPCAFDSGTDISRIVLTVMKFDPEMRSAAVIGYSEGALKLLEDVSILCCGVDHTKISAGISTMDWGIASCCTDGVPDVIYDKGAQKSTGRIYLIGDDAVTVANTIIILSHRIQ